MNIKQARQKIAVVIKEVVADHNGTTPLFGTKIRFVIDVLKQRSG